MRFRETSHFLTEEALLGGDGGLEELGGVRLPDAPDEAGHGRHEGGAVTLDHGHHQGDEEGRARVGLGAI